MDLERHGLRWVHPPACYAHPLPGGGGAGLYRDPRRTAASLDAVHAGDGERWLEFSAPWLRHFRALRDTMLSGFPPVRGPVQLVARHGLRRALELARLLLMPAQGLGDELFEASGSRAWLYGSAMHGDTPPSAAGSAIAAAYLNLLGHAVGWPSPEGGAGRLAEALVGRLRELGGQVRTGARVVAVGTRDGRVSGVRLDDGEGVDGALVVADVMPRDLLRMCGDELPPAYARALRNYRQGQATIKVDWALDGPIPWEAEAAREAGTVHVGGDEPEVLETTSMHATLPEQPFLLVGQQSLADPSRAPAGKHTAWAYTHGSSRNVDWAAEQDAHVERMEQQVERFAPGFRDRILARHVMGPADLERRDANLVDGDVGGGSYSLDQVLFRPVPSASPYRTPIGGLYLGSAATFPGGAVHGVPGHAAGRVALLEARLRRL
jgi:phytoene dehydrogenase-like protein